MGQIKNIKKISEYWWIKMWKKKHPALLKSLICEHTFIKNMQIVFCWHIFHFCHHQLSNKAKWDCKYQRSWLAASEDLHTDSLKKQKDVVKYAWTAIILHRQTAQVKSVCGRQCLGLWLAENTFWVNPVGVCCITCSDWETH